MVEREPRGLHDVGLVGREPPGPRARAARAVERRHGVEVLEHDDLTHRRQAGDDLREPLETVVPAAPIHVAVGGDEHDRLDLAEAVDDPVDAEVG